MKLYTRIIAISLQSNDIEIGEPLIHQMAMGIFYNTLNQKTDSKFTIQTFCDHQLYFHVKKFFVSEKTQKSELCHFSQEIYVTKFCPGHRCSSPKSEKFDEVNLLRKMSKSTFVCFFTNKKFFHIKAKLAVSKIFKSESAVGFLIRCILDQAQCHLVDF